MSTWKLLNLVSSGRIFTRDSLKWVNVIVAAIGAAWVVLVGVFLVVGFNADDPGLPMVLFLMVTIIAVALLLMVVMRALLLQATGLRSELDVVI